MCTSISKECNKWIPFYCCSNKSGSAVLLAYMMMVFSMFLPQDLKLLKPVCVALEYLAFNRCDIY